MENWSNLNIYLSKASEAYSLNEELSKELIKFCLKNELVEIKKCLKKGASLNCYDEHITPLIASIQNDNLTLCYFLIKAGARISYKPFVEFEDAFWYALKNKKHDFLKVFVEKRCILEWSHPKENDFPKTPLIYATINSDVDSVEILLSHYNIKVNQRDGFGNTALHYNIAKETMSQEDIDIGKMLIAAGADTNITNLDGQTPEDLAKDLAGRAVILSGKLEQELDKKEDLPINLEKEDLPNNGVFMTKKGKMKI